MSRSQKKNKFTEPKKPKTGTYVIAGVVILAVIALGGYVAAKKPAAPEGTFNAGTTNYTGQTLEFAKLQANESGGDITIDLNELKTKKTATFDVQGINFTMNNGTPFNYLPLLAYVAPSGNIVVATSLCEPCSGTTFHVEGNELVCNACGTRWTLEDLQGISGGCPQYPPDRVNYTVDGDKLIIKKTDLQNWKPRAV
ncbi:MAG: DUF2318 domain-containing protein [Eubacteriales bacterium]